MKLEISQEEAQIIATYLIKCRDFLPQFFEQDPTHKEALELAFKELGLKDLELLKYNMIQKQEQALDLIIKKLDTLTQLTQK